MILLDQDRLSRFMEGISRGFYRAPLEIAIFFALILSIFLFLIVTYRRQKARAERLADGLAQQRYQQLAQKHALGSAEQELIDRLTVFLSSARKKYLLLVNQPTFNSCAARLLESEAGWSGALDALRLKLGFSLRDSERLPASSAELLPGLPVLLVHGGQRQPGKLSAQEPGYLEIALQSGGPPCGTQVSLYFQNRSGVFAFSTRVLEARGGAVRLSHSTAIKRTQRREYYRQPFQLPVYVRWAGSDQELTATRFIDLGGGGASLRNPERRFKPGDDLELYFQPQHSERLSLLGEVLRVSSGGDVLHLRFDFLKDITRDKIMGLLFKRE